MMHCIRTALSVVRQNQNKVIPVQRIFNIKQLTFGLTQFYSSKTDDIGNLNVPHTYH